MYKNQIPCAHRGQVLWSVAFWLAWPASIGLGQQTGDEPDERIEAAKAAISEGRPVSELDIVVDISDELLTSLESVGTEAAQASGDESVDRVVRSTRRITADESFDFFGVGNFGLRVQLSSRARGSWRGYIIDAPDDRYQDMVILTDLSSLSTGMRDFAAACSDQSKRFPPNDYRMTRTPWSADSNSEWAYWVRQAAVRGNSSGYSFQQIQASIWYITDRSGDYDELPLLRAIGYPSNGPSKNANSSPPPPIDPLPTGGSSTNIGSTTSGCGAGLCGTGFFSTAPLMLAGMAMMKRAYRRGQKP